MPTVLALLFFGSLFLLTISKAAESTLPRVFNLQAGKRYRIAVVVTPRLDALAVETLRAGLLAAAFSDANISSDSSSTFVTYDMTQPIAATFTEGQPVHVGAHVAKLKSVTEL